MENNLDLQNFEELFQAIRKDENYIPRSYQTIGGGWTVDTWKKDHITIQLMDEGYTKRIFTDDLDVFNSFNGKTNIDFKKGNAQDLQKIKEKFDLNQEGLVVKKIKF